MLAFFPSDVPDKRHRIFESWSYAIHAFRLYLSIGISIRIDDKAVFESLIMRVTDLVWSCQSRELSCISLDNTTLPGIQQTLRNIHNLAINRQGHACTYHRQPFCGIQTLQHQQDRIQPVFSERWQKSLRCPVHQDKKGKHATNLPAAIIPS